MIPPRIKDVEVLDNYVLKIIYVNGEKKIFDMKKELKHKYFEKLNNIGYFRLVKNAGVTLEWPNGEDIDPNKLYQNSTLINN